MRVTFRWFIQTLIIARSILKIMPPSYFLSPRLDSISFCRNIHLQQAFFIFAHSPVSSWLIYISAKANCRRHGTYCLWLRSTCFELLLFGFTSPYVKASMAARCLNSLHSNFQCYAAFMHPSVYDIGGPRGSSGHAASGKREARRTTRQLITADPARSCG